MKHVVLSILVALLAVVGGAVVLGPVLRGEGALPAMNAAVGGLALATAVALALPLELSRVVATLLPVLKTWKGGDA